MYSAQPPQPPPMSSANPPLPTQNPQINALIPPVPPPSPSLGFQAWASDPQNAMKVAHNMTPPNQPLQPNAPSAAANPPVTDQYQQNMAMQNPKGLVRPGNLPIWNRPNVANFDGTHSSELSTSFQDQRPNSPNYGKEVLIPTVIDGRFDTPNGQIPRDYQEDNAPDMKAMNRAAWNHYLSTGENLGVFDNPTDANAYAGVLHNRGTALTGSQAPMIQGASTNSLKPPAMASAMPPTPMPNVPAAAAHPIGSPVDADRQKLKDLQASGAGLNQIQNPFLRGLAKVGDVVGSIVSPGISALVPGTTMHNRLLQQHEGEVIAQDQNAIDQSTQQQQNAANLAHTNAETNLTNANIAALPEKLAGVGAKLGMTPTFDDQHQFTGYEPDPNSPIYQKQQAQQGLIKAQTDAYQANVELRNATAAFEKAKMDPNSPLFLQTQQRLKTAQQNAAAAQERAQAYMGNYLQGAYNTGLNGQVLPGAPQIGDESGNTTTVGSKNATNAIKSQANVAQFNDIDGATTNIENAAKNLVKNGGSLNSPGVAAAIADPKTTSAQWLQGKVANSNLTPAERDYVIQVKAYKENLQTLRKSSGGGVSDAQVDRLMALAPGANTPDLDYLMRQTAQIRALRGRLSQGVSTAKGGLSVHGNPMQPPSQTFTDGGITYHIPTNMVADFKKDHPNAR